MCEVRKMKQELIKLVGENPTIADVEKHGASILHYLIEWLGKEWFNGVEEKSIEFEKSKFYCCYGDENDLLDDLNFIHELEAEVIKKVGNRAYIVSLSKTFKFTNLVDFSALPLLSAICNIATADAKTRITAIVLAIMEAENE